MFRWESVVPGLPTWGRIAIASVSSVKILVTLICLSLSEPASAIGAKLDATTERLVTQTTTRLAAEEARAIALEQQVQAMQAQGP